MDKVREIKNPEESGLVLSLAKIIGAVGAIALIVYFSPISPIELFNWFLLVLLPIFGILLMLRIISHETVGLVWNRELDTRVKARLGEMYGWAKDTKTEYVSA